MKRPYKFYCFTEDPEGVDKNIIIQPLKNKWQGWWSKVNIFDPDNYKEESNEMVFYIDLDMIVTGNIDELCSYRGNFLVMSTNDIDCESAKNGYNSSIMIFQKNFGLNNIKTNLISS